MKNHTEKLLDKMELSDEELAKKRLQGKLKILRESRRILDELYWENVRKERELLNKETSENFIETQDKIIELSKKRRKIMDEIREIDDQLGF
jgi:hypothetical protein